MAVLTIPARSSRTVTREVDGEYVVLATATDQVHALAGLSAEVWRAAGTTADVDPAAVQALVDLGLLDTPGLTRRSLLKRTGAVAAGVGIASIALPMAQAAASPPVAAITLTPSTGPVGTTVTVSGTNFPASQGPVVITYDGNTVTTSPASPTTNGSGAFSATFVVPASTFGVHTVSAVVGGKSASANYSVVAQVTSAPASLPRNGGGTAKSVVLSGTGYAANSHITIVASGDYSGATVPTTVTTNASGSFTATVTNITYANGSGSGTFTATDAAGHTDSVAVAH